MIDKAYNAKDHEANIYKLWEESGNFAPKMPEEISASDKSTARLTGSQANAVKKPFVIAMPPPNVTGKLHIGHALFITLQDILTRYHRMLGEPTLWIPGTDHAGIATQTVVDKALQKKGTSRRQLGREKFVEEVWKWKEEYGNEITHQLRSVGASCDWSRERFTLDEGLTLAVNTAFVDFYKKGLIYRGEYIVNWCPKCATAIADDEVEHKPQVSKLYYFKYDKNFPITIATTRPETKFGDTAVAVNPSDKRYEKFVGLEFEIDLDGVKRKIKIIADRVVDKAFGTGAVGVTPAHSMADWKLSEDHDLEKIKVINERGRMNENAGKYADLKVLEAREKLVEYLKENDLIEKEEEFENNLSICYRCNTAIEPLPSLQWFVKMKPLAEKAKEAVKDGEIKIIPKRFEKVYFHWMDNIHDWCISRQLWWGHRIPVWYRKRKPGNLKTMGFAESVVPEVFDGKTQTWRVRDHELKVSDKVYFENSGSAEIFGYGIINKSAKHKVKDMPLQDKAHGKTYESVEELIAGFKSHNPDKEITPESDAWIYGYDFVPKEKFENSECHFEPVEKSRKQISRLPVSDRTTRDDNAGSDCHASCLPARLRWAGAMTQDQNEEIYVGVTPPPDPENWVQDEDVLDTWFSSGLWPFSTLGWPNQSTKSEIRNPKQARNPNVSNLENSNLDIVSNFDIRASDLSCKPLDLPYAPGLTDRDYDYFYPTSVMETGYDILFFWVARMVMMGLELTGKAPFETVYLHGLVRDEKNRKMSKSLGNVLNPLDVSEKFGTDAMRMALVVGTAAGQDIAVGESKVQGYRNFANKIWNISRFIMMNLENSKGESDKLKDINCHCERLAKQSTQISRQARDDTAGSDCHAKPALSLSNGLAMTTEDKKDLEEFEKLKEIVTKALDKLEFSRAGEHLYGYTWHEFADKIIERSKDRLQNEGEDKNAALAKLLKINIELLKMLHPFMPFVTESIWQQLPDQVKDNEMLMVASWPRANKE